MREVQRNSFYMFKWLLPVHACVLSCFSHVWLHNPMGCSLSGSSVHGILQARILEWVAISFSWGTSWPRDQTRISVSPALAASSLPLAPPGKPYHCSFSRMYQGSGHRMIRASSMEWMPLWYFTNSPLTHKKSKWVRTAQKSISMPHRLRRQALFQFPANLGVVLFQFNTPDTLYQGNHNSCRTPITPLQ